VAQQFGLSGERSMQPSLYLSPLFPLGLLVAFADHNWFRTDYSVYSPYSAARGRYSSARRPAYDTYWDDSFGL